MKLSFFVHGPPVTQGSMRAFVNKHTGRAAITSNNGGKLQLWRHAVSDEARKVRGEEDATPFAGPIAMRLTFRLLRPASAPKRKVTYPIGARSGDIDKLSRSVLDALTGVLFQDDSQVTSLVACKEWGEPGALIEMENVTP